MVFNQISFNEDYWKGKTEEEFIAHESHWGLTKSQLKEAYSLLNKKKVVNKSPVDTGAVDKKTK